MLKDDSFDLSWLPNLNLTVLRFVIRLMLKILTKYQWNHVCSMFIAYNNSIWLLQNYLHAISSNSFMTSFSNSDGRCFEKKSFKAVATAFTGTSSASISTFGSKQATKTIVWRINRKKKKNQMTWAHLTANTRFAYLLAIFGIKVQRVHDYRARDKYPPNQHPLVR